MAGRNEDVTIDPQSRVSLALLGGIFAVTSAALVGGTRWATRIETRLERIEGDLSTVARDRWSRTDMRIWADDLQRANPNLVVPVPNSRAFTEDH